MLKTIPETQIGKTDISYWVNSALSLENRKIINDIQKVFLDKYKDAVTATHTEGLHISLMNWVSPMVEYGRPKEEIFEEIKTNYDRAMQSALKDEKPVEVRFNKVVVARKAIIIQGSDNGQYERIRAKWLSQVELLPGNRKPPEIIHTSIIRFVKEIDLEPIKDFAEDLSVDFIQKVDTFRLVKETTFLMNDFSLIKTYEI